MIERHLYFTNSPLAKIILQKWDSQLPMFVKVMPIDYRKSLERMKMSEYPDIDTVAVTEEVFNG
jgi:glutamate synthase domain-containing protein 3